MKFYSDDNLCRWITTFLVVLQFVVLPGLSSVSVAGKGFTFFFGVLGFTALFMYQRSSLKFPRVFWLLLIFELLLLLSSATAFIKLDAFLLCGFMASGLLLLLIVSNLSVSGSRFSDLLLDSLLVGGVLAASLGLYEFFHFLWLGPSTQILIPLLLPQDLSYRVVGMLGQPNLFALLLCLCLLVFSYRYLHRPFTFVTLRWHFLRFTPFFLVALVFFLTESRAGLLSFSLIFIYLALLVIKGRYPHLGAGEQQELRRLLICLVMAFGLYQLLHIYGPARFAVDRGLTAVSGVSVDARFVFWLSAILLFIEHPVLGIGLDNFRYMLQAKVVAAHDLLRFVEYETLGHTNWAHNELLQVLCEAGLPAFLLLLLLLFLLLRKLQSFFSPASQTRPFFLYAHLFLLPFILQSMFSWPLRHPSLLALFLVLLGVLLAEYPIGVFEVRLSLTMRRFFQGSLLLALVAVSLLFWQEVRTGSFLAALPDTDQLERSLATFAELSDNPYSELTVLETALPVYAGEALRRDDAELAIRLLPYAERLAQLRGLGWEWYLLANLYLKCDRLQDARKSIARATTQQPLDNHFWDFQHYLNMLHAAEQTGRPLEDFISKRVGVDFVKPEFSYDRN